MPDVHPTPAAVTEPNPAPAPPAAAGLVRTRPPTLYRVVEVGLDRDGRLRTQGRVWHTDVERARRFGRVVAGHSPAACDVFVADSAGGVIERIPMPAPDRPATPLAGWQSLPLPPAPPRRPPRGAHTLPAKTLPTGAGPAPSSPPLDGLTVGERTVPNFDPVAVAAARAGRSVDVDPTR